MKVWDLMEEKGFEINTYYDVRDFEERNSLRRI